MADAAAPKSLVVIIGAVGIFKGGKVMGKYRASPKSTKIKNGCTRTKRSSGNIGSMIARQNARRRAR